MRESWTDERLDDFAAHVDRRFDEVDRRFGEVDRRFDKIDRQLERLDDRLDSMLKAIIGGFVVQTGGILAGFSAILILIATQL